MTSTTCSRAIMGYAEMALEQAADAPRLRTHLQHVITSGQRANNLVRQILTFSRHRETNRRPVSPGPIVAEPLKLMRSSLPAYIDILQRIDATDCVLADPPQLNQIVMNLCANAAQSMEPRGRERVLVVDDEAPPAGLMGEILGNLGYAVEMRTSSTEALKLFRARPADFNLVITDMAMPGMTGEQLSQELRKRSPCIPIILCTGFSRIMSEQRARALGINAFLYKPVSSRELARTVRTILDAS